MNKIVIGSIVVIVILLAVIFKDELGLSPKTRATSGDKQDIEPKSIIEVSKSGGSANDALSRQFLNKVNELSQVVK